MQEANAAQQSVDTPEIAAFFLMTPDTGEELVRQLKAGDFVQLCVPNNMSWKPFIALSHLSAQLLLDVLNQTS